MKIRVAGIQMPIGTDVNQNLKTILEAINLAVQDQADILLTPEGSLSGYNWEFNQEMVEKALIEILAKAKEKQLGLALGLCFKEEEDGKIYNQIRFYEKDGVYLGFHSKILNCVIPENPDKGEYYHFAVKPLNSFIFKDIPIGGLICNDMWATPGFTIMHNPLLCRELSRKGVRIVFHSVNTGVHSGSEWNDVKWNYHESNLRLLAKANQVWIVTADNCSVDMKKSQSPSGIINPDGDWITQAPIPASGYFCESIEIYSQ